MGWAYYLRRSTFTANGAARILLFHRIAEPTSLAVEPNTAITAESFRSVIGEVAERYKPLSLHGFVGRLRRGQVTDGCVVVTFDDGFADNLQMALPILEEFNVPAMVYVTSGFVQRQRKPFEYQLAQIVSHSNSVDFAEQSWATDSLEKKKECYEAIRSDLHPTSDVRREAAIEELCQGVNDWSEHSAFEFLTVGQLRQLDASPLITIGAHTRAHLVLTAVSQREAKNDIRLGKQWLEEQLDHPIVDFAYPYGAFDSSIRKCVGVAGFRTAVTTIPQPVRGKCDLLTLPRSEIHADIAESPESLLRLLGP